MVVHRAQTSSRTRMWMCCHSLDEIHRKCHFSNPVDTSPELMGGATALLMALARMCPSYDPWCCGFQGACFPYAPLAIHHSY